MLQVTRKRQQIGASRWSPKPLFRSSMALTSAPASPVTFTRYRNLPYFQWLTGAEMSLITNVGLKHQIDKISAVNQTFSWPRAHGNTSADFSWSAQMCADFLCIKLCAILGSGGGLICGRIIWLDLSRWRRPDQHVTAPMFYLMEENFSSRQPWPDFILSPWRVSNQKSHVVSSWKSVALFLLMADLLKTRPA